MAKEFAFLLHRNINQGYEKLKKPLEIDLNSIDTRIANSIRTQMENNKVKEEFFEKFPSAYESKNRIILK